MPGTILVSALEFQGLQSSSSTPPQISIKVSMGKKEYQTSGKEDFSFPLTTLRDNLVIKLHDAVGNEISRAGVDTRLVVEKGLWDETFPLEGGGNVHLKLQFVLSEEERQRIRIMRESALRKKHGELPGGYLRSLENATTVGSNAELSLCLSQEVSETSLLQSEVAATQAGLASTPADVIKKEGFGTEELEETFFLQKQKIPVDVRRLRQSPVSQGFDVHLTEVSHKGFDEKIETETPLYNVHEGVICMEEASSLFESSKLVVASKNKSIAPKLEEDEINNPEKQIPLQKTPSNVRNMISAFESSLAQDMRSPMKSPPVKSQFSKIETEAPLRTSILQEFKTEKAKPTQPISVGRLKIPFFAGGLQQAATYTREGDEHGSTRAFNEVTTYQDTRQLELSAADVKNKRTTADMKNKLINKEVDKKEGKASSGDFMRASTGKTATVSGRMLDENIGRQQSGKFYVDKQNSGGTLSIKENGKGIYPEHLEEWNNNGASNDRLKSKENWKDKHYSSICPGIWIFPVESRRLCITTGSKHLMDLMGHCQTEAEIHRGEKGSAPENVEEIQPAHPVKVPYSNNIICEGLPVPSKSSVHGRVIKVNEGEKTNQKSRKSKFMNSPDVETSRGPVGQVMRIAIMIGFATLVVFTRQKQ